MLTTAQLRNYDHFQHMEHVGRVPMLLLNSPLDQGGEVFVSWGRVWTETMASLIAVMAGRDNI